MENREIATTNENEILNLKLKIEQKQSRIDLLMTNEKTIRMAKKEIKNWKTKIKSLELTTPPKH